eukprot:scaffold1182_cov229-Ochromonas_danica.AAC.1
MQSSLNRSYKHPTYGNKPTPSLQLLAQLSKFDGKRKESIADVAELVKLQEQDNSYRGTVEESQQRYINSQDTRQTVIPSKSNASNATTLLDPTFRTDDSKEMSLKAAQTRHHYTYNSHMNASVGKLLYSKGEGLPTELNMPTKRMANPTVSNMDNSLIGGLPAGDDAWVTTAQLSSNGEALEQKKPHGKKVVHSFNPELFVSPITGEPIADYGDWVEDRKTGKPGNNSNNSAEDDLKALQKSDPVMYKLKTQLALRGAKGSIGLSRVFRIMDDDGSRSLSFSEFKKAMQEFGMALNDTELVILFKRFDTQQSGSISYEQFLRTIAGTLNARRRQLVQQAFDVLDKDGSGCIELSDIAMAYDASKHPDVISGKRTAEQVLLEFLEGFDVGGDKDNKVTRQEFENYYAGISSSIDRDDYFELMIRNAWHLSGGEGFAANTANLRVLVTRLDGSQTIEVIQNDLGLKKGDSAAIIARLKAQGIPVASISLFDGGDDNKMSLSRNSRPPRGGNTMIKTMAINSNNRPKTANRENPTDRSSEPSAGLKMIIDKIKAELKSRGSAGFVGLQRRFKIMDDDGNRSLDLSEFKKAMKEMRIIVADSDMRMLFEHFDADGSGGIDFEEFVQAVRDPLNPRRLRLVHQAFTILDKDGSGEVDAKEISSMYDASKHPEVMAKRKTATQVLREFLDTFDVGGVKDGIVTRDEFVNYYTNIGASIDNDDYFELMIRNAWHMTNSAEGGISSTSNMAVLVTDSSGVERRVILENDLGVKPNDTSQIYARLRSQGVGDIRAINGKIIKVLNINGVDVVTTQGEVTSQINNSKGSSRPPPLVQRAPPAQRPQSASSMAILNRQQQRLAPTPTSTTRPIAQPLDPSVPSSSSSLKTNQAQFANKILNRMQTDDAQKNKVVENQIVGSTLLDVLRSNLLSKGPTGIIDLQRKFIELDVDNSKALDLSEFKVALSKCGIPFSDAQAQSLFTFLDKDSNGGIDYQELLNGLRGPFNPTLLVLAHRAFDHLDPQGTNLIDPQQILLQYDAAKHPDVTMGKRKADEVLQELLDTFDVGAVVAGKITRDEFATYYHNLAAASQDDDYLEIVLRRTWHIGDDVGLTKLLDRKSQQQEQAGRNSDSGGKVLGRIKEAQEFSEEYWGVGNNQNAGVSRPTTSSGYQGRLSYQSTSAAQPSVLVTPRGDQGFASRPKSASGGGSIRRTTNLLQQQANNPATKSAMEEKIRLTQRQAILLFNQNNFEEALSYFEESLKLLQMIYPSNHPECIKAEKSILLTQRKMETL